ncbi:hypothetical protein ColKHC_10157 [Colletotrichum higginsianum]|nr:hypothetical protein ColKHC_10157 [Colletotrichum higginsianum]
MENRWTVMSSCMLSTKDGPMKYCMKLDLCSSRDSELRSAVSSRLSVLPYGLRDSRILDGGLEADSVDESDDPSLALRWCIGFEHEMPLPMILLRTAILDRPLTADRGTGRTKTQSRPFIMQRSHCGLPSVKVHFDFW